MKLLFYDITVHETGHSRTYGDWWPFPFITWSHNFLKHGVTRLTSDVVWRKCSLTFSTWHQNIEAFVGILFLFLPKELWIILLCHGMCFFMERSSILFSELALNMAIWWMGLKTIGISRKRNVRFELSCFSSHRRKNLPEQTNYVIQHTLLAKMWILKHDCSVCLSGSQHVWTSDVIILCVSFAGIGGSMLFGLGQVYVRHLHHKGLCHTRKQTLICRLSLLRTTSQIWWKTSVYAKLAWRSVNCL